MITVYLVDNKTRLHLPDSAWGNNALSKIKADGHTVQALDEDQFAVERDEAEMKRVDRLLTKYAD